MFKNFIITQIDDNHNLEWCDVLVHGDSKLILKFNTERDAFEYLLNEADLTPQSIEANNILIAQLH
jgi:hypothetical protein|tara:strand:+ start:253 stop:450 length:198 start_codon:yes stop_codon:yes gene_type:complete